MSEASDENHCVASVFTVEPKKMVPKKILQIARNKNFILRSWSLWLALLSRKEQGTSLALFRIAVGATAFLSLFSTVFVGLVDVIWVGKEFGGLNHLRSYPFLIEFLGGPSPTVVYSMVALCGMSLFSLGVGFQTRLAAFIAGQTYMSLYRLNPFAHGSYDLVITNALWVLVLAESAKTISIDCKIRMGKWRSNDVVSAWPRGLVILNIVLLYGTTGMQKVSIYWTPAGGYSALYYILQQPSWQRFEMSWVASFYLLTQLGTFVTWVWEVSAPFLLFGFFFLRLFPTGKALWPRPFQWFLHKKIDLRLVFVLIGFCMHGLVLLFMDVGPFSFITLSLYICLFSSEEWNRFFQRLQVYFVRTSIKSTQKN